MGRRSRGKERHVRTEPATAEVAGPAGAPRASRTIQILVVLLLAGPTLVATAQRIASNIGLDFYNFWGVSAALRTGDGHIGDPYENGTRYLDRIRQVVASSGDDKLQAVSREWSAPDFTGSPLLYTIFGAVSREYTGALSAFQVMQVIAFLASCLFLAHIYRFGLFSGACLALISLIGYQPFVADLRVANLGCLQLALLAALLACARMLHERPHGRRGLLLCSAVLALLAAATLTKPNIALIAGFLALHLAVRHGRRVFLIGSGVAGVVALTLFILPCVYFGTWTVWRDWYGFVYGADPLMLVRSVVDGNYSTVAMVSHALGVGVRSTAMAIGTTLVASLGVATTFAGAAREDTGAAGGPVRRAARHLVARMGEEPELALAIGVGLTMAVSPLLWFHYYLIALIPCFWLLHERSGTRVAAWCAAASMVLSSGVPGILIGLALSEGAVAWATAISWIPLWAGVLVMVARPADRTEFDVAAIRLVPAGASE